jgi:uncharacterized membrane protein (UPF0182 family)
MATVIRPQRRPSGGRPVLLLLFAAAVVGLLSARSVAGFYTDYLWFGSLGFTGVWSGLFWAKVGLAALFIVVAFGLVWVNLFIADRIAPAFRPPGPEENALEAVHAVFDRRPSLARVVAAFLPALLLGPGVAAQWNDWILFRNRVNFGIGDPQFGRDVGFYVFQLPFLSFLVDWLFASLVLITLITTAAHYRNGGIRLQAPGTRITPAVRGHLSILLASIALVRAASYYLDRFEITFSTRGVVHGATYTDVHAKLPAINLLIAISVLAALLLLYNVRLRGWVLPGIAVGLWALVAVVVGTAYPAFVQRFRVEPAESVREAPFIQRNITATRAAMGLQEVRVQPFAYDEKLSVEALDRNRDTIRNVRLWDPRVLQQTYQRLQEVRTFYRFTDVDIDRYKVPDPTQTMLSARELNPGSLPSDTWENRHLAFTHGYGAVMSPANGVTVDGQPAFLTKDIPPQGDPPIVEPRLYHGESIPGFAIVNTGRDEIDYVKADGTAVTNRYDGRGGVGLGSVPRRLAFALRFADVNPLISGFMTSQSRILYVRDIRERVRTLAPFLHYDADPYPVVLDGRIVWLIDAYTTTDRYPYGQQAERDRLGDASGLNHEFNYVRNSVKVAIDAYDGTVTFYLIDRKDPIAAAYAKAFPKLFAGPEKISTGLRAHFRYPEDLFRVQTNMWGRYHIGDPKEFYSQSDRWNISQDPGTGRPPEEPPVGAPLAAPAQPGQPSPSRQRRMDPYYLLMRLPGETNLDFFMLQPFVPFSQDDSRRELSAFMVAKGDPQDYGQLEVFVMPRDRQVDGPAIVNARINQDPEVSQLVTLLSRAGSEVRFGNLVIIPVEQSLIYVRPLYVQATGANAVPELKKVIVVFGGRIAIRDTFQEALVAVFGAAPPTQEQAADGAPSGGPAPTGAGGVTDEVRRLLDDAAQAFADADAALRNGDPVEYARKVQEGRQLFERARQAAGATPPPTSNP